MVRNPCAHLAGPMRAAHVHVEFRLRLELPRAPDAYMHNALRYQHQRIGVGAGLNPECRPGIDEGRVVARATSILGMSRTGLNVNQVTAPWQMTVSPHAQCPRSW